MDRGGDRRRELVRTGGPWGGAASERTVDRLTLGRGGFGTEPGQVDLGQGRLRSGVRTGGPGGGATSGRTADRSSSGRSGAPERAGQVLPGGGGAARRWGQAVRGGDRGPERSWTGCPASRAAPPKGWDRLPRGLSCVFRGVDSASCPEKGFSAPVKLAEAAERGVAVLSVGWKGSTEGWVSGSGEVSASFLRRRALCGYHPPRAPMLIQFRVENHRSLRDERMSSAVCTAALVFASSPQSRIRRRPGRSSSTSERWYVAADRRAGGLSVCPSLTNPRSS